MIPVASTYSFCNFVLLQITKRLTPARLTLVQSVQAAALAQTYISDSDWNNFLLATSDYYRTWQINKDFNPEYIYDADTLLYLAQLPTQPTPFRVELLNSLIVQLKADGNWTELDRFWIHATEYKDNAIVSLVNPTSTKCTEHNAPTWTANEGYTGNGSSMYLDTNYKPSTSAVKLSLNSESMGVYVRNSTSANPKVVMGCENSSTSLFAILCRYTGDIGIVMTCNSSAGGTSTAITNTQGLTVGVRTASNLSAFWKNGIQKNTSTYVSVSLPAYNVYLLADNLTGTASTFDNKQVAISFIGSGAVNQLKLYNAIQTYMTAIGKQV